MSVRARRFVGLAALLVLGGIVAVLPSMARSAEREVVVVAQQMSFFVGEGGIPNPVIRLSPGERVRITLISADPGFDHDFVVEAWDVRTPMLRGEGRASIVVQAPDEPGSSVEYVCSAHAAMMRGTIEVVAPDAATPSR
jgi:hypothetical protein